MNLFTVDPQDVKVLMLSYLCVMKVNAVHREFLYIFQEVYFCLSWSHSSKHKHKVHCSVVALDKTY